MFRVLRDVYVSLYQRLYTDIGKFLLFISQIIARIFIYLKVSYICYKGFIYKMKKIVGKCLVLHK